MQNVTRLSADVLLDRVYETAARPGAWTDVLEGVCDLVGAANAVLVLQDLSDRTGDVAEYVRVDPDLMRAYEEQYAAINPIFQSTADADLVPGRVLLNYVHALPLEELTKTEFYHGFFKPMGDVLWSANVVLFRDDALTGNLSIQRARQAGPFSPEDVALLERLGPHIRRAVQLRRRFGSLEVEREAFSKALERLGQAVFVIEGAHRVVSMNGAAEALLRAGDALRLCRDRRLAAATPAADASLRGAVTSAVDGPALDARGLTVPIPRRSGRAPLVATVSPLPRALAHERGVHRAVVVCIADPEKPVKLSRATLRKLHGLTSAEARLAALLTEGKSLQEIAGELELSVQTVRTQLKQVFAKTGTRRQAELVSLLMRTRTGQPVEGEALHRVRGRKQVGELDILVDDTTASEPARSSSTTCRP